MSSAGRKENTPGRGQSLFRSASPSGQTDLHGRLANRNHKYSWCRELQHLLGSEVHTAQWPQGPASSFKGRVQLLQLWGVSHRSTHAHKGQYCFLPFAMYEAHISRQSTLPCSHRGKMDPDFISHHSLPLVFVHKVLFWSRKRTRWMAWKDQARHGSHPLTDA